MGLIESIRSEHKRFHRSRGSISIFEPILKAEGKPRHALPRQDPPVIGTGFKFETTSVFDLRSWASKIEKYSNLRSSTRRIRTSDRRREKNAATSSKFRSGVWQIGERSFYLSASKNKVFCSIYDLRIGRTTKTILYSVFPIRKITKHPLSSFETKPKIISGFKRGV